MGEIFKAEKPRAAMAHTGERLSVGHSLETEIEQCIKELSNCLLYPDTPSSELSESVRKFEIAVQNMRSIQEVLQTSIQRVRMVGEQLLRT